MRTIEHLAFAADLSGPTADHAVRLVERLRAEHGGDETAVEAAFSAAVRAAWVGGEPWAVEWVEKATGGAVGA